MSWPRLTSETPGAADRTVSFGVNDGAFNSNIAGKNVTVVISAAASSPDGIYYAGDTVQLAVTFGWAVTSLNGATIKNTATGHTADLTLPVPGGMHSIAGNSDIAMDAVPAAPVL